MGQGQEYPLPAAAAFATAARFADQVGTRFSHALTFEEFYGPAAAQPAGLVFHTPASTAGCVPGFSVAIESASFVMIQPLCCLSGNLRAYMTLCAARGGL